MNTVTPPQALDRLITGALTTQMLAIAARLRIPDILSEGLRDVDKLARELGVSADPLHRMLRALASHGVFTETEPRVFGLTPMAELLRSDVPGSQRLWAMFNGAPWHWAAAGHAAHSVETGEPAFNAVFRQGSFEYFNSNASAGRLFYGMMTQMTEELLPKLLEAYDFSRRTRVIDVGGGHGSFLWAILDAYPEIRGTLFDLPAVIDQARSEATDSPLLARADFAGGDFFERVPEGGDAYLLKYIVHDWDDDKSAQILDNCRRAMASDGRVLVMDHVLAPGNEPCSGKMLDLTMMLMQGGRERTESEFRTLFDEAGLAISRIIPVAGSMCIVEGERA